MMSAIITSARLVSNIGGKRHTMLFDTGPEGPIFLRNCANLGIRLGEVEAIAVTHGHWDHMAALPATIDRIIEQGGRVTVHVNPGMFNERAIRLSGGRIVPVANVPLPPELDRHGARVVNNLEDRLLLDGHFYYSGEIPRVTPFEKGRDDHFCRKNPEAPWEPDPLLLDERMLVAKVRGLGDGRTAPRGCHGTQYPRDGGRVEAVHHRPHHHWALHRLACLARSGQCLW